MNNISTEINPRKYGQIIQNFLKGNASLVNKWDQTYSLTDIYGLWEDCFNEKINIIENEFNSLHTGLGILLQPLDILKNNNNNYYIILNINNDATSITTFPFLPKDVKISEFFYQRPKLPTNTEKIFEYEASLTNSNIMPSLSIDEIIAIEHLEYPESALQIGDLVFIVDPTSISLTTQNGYQYFPTFRTNGNPQIPTFEQIKNINISLIFPNTDSINNQLLHLYAMFKRTPFVNLRNIDICNFYIDLLPPESKYLSVALESINIQSIPGFPNSCQVSINVLPFDPTSSGSSLKALKTFEDVVNQFNLLNIDREKNSVLNLVSTNLDIDNYMMVNIPDGMVVNSSDDFRESIPFRSFYQSLISGQNYITDEHGNLVKSTKQQAILIDQQLKPQPNALGVTDVINPYIEDNNSVSYSFKYKYLNPTKDILRNISSARFEYDLKHSLMIKNIEDLTTPEGLAWGLIDAVYNEKTFWENFSYELKNKNATIDKLLITSGINVEKKYGKLNKGMINNVLGFMLQDFSAGINVYKTLNQQIQTTTPTSADYTKFFNLYYNQINEESITGNENQLIPFMTSFNQLIKSLEDRDVKTEFNAFLLDLTGVIKKEITQESISENGLNLPIESELITFDYKENITTSWNLIFANKFVPIYLQGRKYPIYQHIGSEDPQISLQIRSIKTEYNDLKSSLSLMSDRLYDSVKTVLLTAPELFTYLDPRIEIDAPKGSIFDVFNIKKVVYNSSSVNNVQGSPNLWDITLRLTSANFSIHEYHKIETYTTNNDIEKELMSLLVRSKYDSNSDKVTVYNYYDDKGNIVTDINYILAVSNMCEDGIIKFFKDLNPPKDISYIKTMRKMDSSATSKLNEILNLNENVKNIYKSLLNIYNNLINEELKTLTTIYSSTEHVKLEDGFSSLLIGAGGSVGAYLANGVKLVRLAMVGPASLALLSMMLVYWGLDAGLSGKLADKIDDVKKQLSPNGLTLTQRYRDVILLNTIKRIVKDPILTKIFLVPELFNGQDLNSILNQRRDTNITNCYNDFNIIPIYTFIKDKKEYKINIAPNFYMYDNVLDDESINNFISDELTRLKTTKQIIEMTYIGDYQNTLELFENSKEKIIKNFTNYKDICVSSNLSEETNKNYERLASLYKYDIFKGKNIESIIEYTGDEKNINIDSKKLSIILSTRYLILIKLMIVYNNINDALGEKIGINNSGIELSKDNSIINKLNEIKTIVKGIVDNYDATPKINGQNIELGSAKITIPINKGIADNSESGKEKNYLTVNGILHLQNYLYNLTADYIKINEAIAYYKSKNDPSVFNSLGIPEIDFLNRWNFREYETGPRKIRLLRDLDFYNTRKNKNSKNTYFPTYKIYFIEDGNSFMNVMSGTLYSINSVQSIEIVANKKSAGRTAVLKISNITGTLTDRYSLAGESSDITPNISSKSSFFGTLDVKPGTKIVIKLGYEANDKKLQTVFVGRIVEMGIGPVTELICQSFGTQLNHQIKNTKFGYFESTKEHGDVAMTILDMIPGLNGLGSLTMNDMFGDGTFSTKAYLTSQKNVSDKFMMTSILGASSQTLFAMDNPRNENIYLPFSIKWEGGAKSRFDWIVYEQSAWSSLNELAIQHRNTIVTTKLYNDDGYSNISDIRETIVMGDKSGFFKYTDAFDLSNTNFNAIKEAVEILKSDGFKKNFASFKSNFMRQSDITGDIVTIERELGPKVNIINNDVKNINKYFKDNLYIDKILVYMYLKYITPPTDNKIDVLKLTYEELMNDYLPFIKRDSSESLFINGILKIKQSNIKYTYDYYDEIYSLGVIAFEFEKFNFSTITPDMFYHIKLPIIDNNASELVKDSRYKKIQKQHFINDASNIINNNITLNTNFANVIKLYFPNEPIYTADQALTEKDWKGMNSFTIKSFGDISDDAIRIREIFQNNIDPNWAEISSSTKTLMEYSKNNEEKLDFTKYPIVYTAALSLLQREVSQMYDGVIQIIGDPTIDPYDIIHIDDNYNDMHGSIEVEEVVHIFTPEEGFKTVITPSMLTYDRDPIALEDASFMNRSTKILSNVKTNSSLLGYAGAAITYVAGTGAVGAGLTVAGIGSALFALTIGLPLTVIGVKNSILNETKYIYDQFANVYGRDCINFNTLYYKGVPYMSGFDGVDYTTIRSMINHKSAKLNDTVRRWVTSLDSEYAYIFNNGNIDNNNSILKQFVSTMGLKYVFPPEVSSNANVSLLSKIIGY